MNRLLVVQDNEFRIFKEAQFTGIQVHARLLLLTNNFWTELSAIDSKSHPWSEKSVERF
jgi:hypothetical protein